MLLAFRLMKWYTGLLTPQLGQSRLRPVPSDPGGPGAGAAGGSAGPGPGATAAPSVATPELAIPVRMDVMRL